MKPAVSILTGKIPEFSTIDYVVFGLLLALFSGVGLFYAIKDKLQKKQNADEFLLGSRSMHVLPVAFSLTVTFLSALTILGNPAEMYNYNTMFMYLALTMILSMIGAGVIFIPFFYRLGVTSTFQYLEWRFHISVRLLGSSILVVQTLIYMSFVLYAPSLALSAVTGLDLWGCVISVGLVVTFYTTMGGMKAVLLTDSLQYFVMVAGLLAVFIQGCIELDGFSNAWGIAEQRGRIVFDDFSGNPATRHSFWSIVVGGTFLWTSLFGVNQAQVQRCLSTSSVRNAQLAILVNTPNLLMIVILTCLIGVVMFAFYANCDPVNFGVIGKTDQLLPLFVMDTLGHLKGLPGIFVSCVFSGSLSSLSSALNALSTVIYKDFIQIMCCGQISDFKATLINKSIIIMCGCLAIGLAYLTSQLGNVLQASYAVYGLLSGPVFGLFILGMFFPWANKWGAVAGALSSLVFMMWIGFGAFIHKVSTSVKSPVYIHGCNWTLPAMTVVTAITTETTAATESNSGYEGVYRMYTLSYLYYTLVGVIVVLVVGLIVSFLTGYTRPSTIDPRYICPVFDIVFPCLPEVILRPLRFGIDHKGKFDKDKYVVNGKDKEYTAQRAAKSGQTYKDFKFESSNEDQEKGGKENLALETKF